MPVEPQFKTQCDRIAAYKKALAAAVVGRTTLWSLVDAAENEIYENRVKGATITGVDTDALAGKCGSIFSEWIDLHNVYFRDDAALSGIDGALTSYKWRISQYLRVMIDEAGRGPITVANVFPRDDLDMGSFQFTNSVFATGNPVDITKSAPGRVSVVANGAIGATNALALSVTVTREDGTSASLAASLAASSPSGTTVILGEQALSANAASGQKVVSVAATAQFKVAEKVFIKDNNAEEWGTVASIVTNTSITLVNNLRNSYTTAATAKCWPLFKDVTACTASTGNAGDQVNFRVSPDRVVALS